MGKIGVKIKRLHPDAMIPVHKTSGSAGFDLYSVEDKTILPGEIVKIGTGISLEVPAGHCVQLWGRSGLEAKGIRKLAGLGDSDYRGEYIIVLHNLTDEVYQIRKHDRIAQGVILPVFQAEFEEVSELGETERGTGGFHSTGRNDVDLTDADLTDARGDKLEIIIIAGVARNGVIGQGNKLPWHISEDLKHFKELTWGNPVIMGRTTYLSILDYLGKPLPGRTNIVLSNVSSDFYNGKEGFLFCKSIDEALEVAKRYGKKVFVMGGASVYSQMMGRADSLEITHIDKDFEGDIFFPRFDVEEWKEVSREEKEGKDFRFGFVRYERKKKDEVSEGDGSRTVEKLTGEKTESKNDFKVENKKKGIFVAFEGVDGSGKSTQVRKFVRHVFEKDKYNHIVITRSPYKDVSIREILRDDGDALSQAEKLADLFVSDRTKQSEEIISPNLDKGYFVISDRFKLSTVAYQGAQGIDMKKLVERQKGLPVPDITFIIDVPISEASRRIKAEDESVRGKEHKFETDLDFLDNVRRNYLKAKAFLSGEKVFIIDGNRAPDEIFEEIKGIFDREILGC